ncbi:MAG TPA: hypothetical protein VGH28_28590 [Polyangiaceae bacterium]|jgi:hypothetical protein
MTKIEIIGLGACAIVAALSFECGTTPECDVDAGCADASSVPPVSGGGCDSSKPPSQGGCAVDDTDGFFVSPAGSDTGVGSKAAPFQTIGRGILAAAGNVTKPNVYICQGTYAENLVIQTAPAGVALHGGFDCTGWTQTSAPTTVAPKWMTGDAEPQYVLDVIGAAALVESMTLTAPDATDPGASSIAAFVNGSPGMTFRRAAVTSGHGADAVPVGLPPAALPANADGNPAVSDTQGGASRSCPCATDTTTGGAGGAYNGSSAIDPMGGLPIEPADPEAGAPGPCTGPIGADGADGGVGASATSIGVLTASGWQPGGGAAGVIGATGQGGAGGGFRVGGPPNAGGSGACGGCGGEGAPGGAAGGASLAIVVLNATLRIQASSIHAGSGGQGGDGGAIGQAGQPGGSGGIGSPALNGVCHGGAGGTGGAGGPGGGGAGGSSVAIATVATTPDIDAFSTVLAGTAGKGGHDGSPQAVKAVDGVAEVTHAF